jgi:hypothetical protein
MAIVKGVSFYTVQGSDQVIMRTKGGATLTGEWHSAQTIVPEHELTVQIDPTLTALLTDSVSVVLSIGIGVGTSGFTDEIVAVKHAGCGKTLAVR